jgi:cold shock CspA family protein/ribosome-associated translation inhibitor RaiA
MERPVNITFRGMPPSDALTARIHQKAAWLEKVHDHVVGCDIVVDAPHTHSRKGGLFEVTIELRVPGGPPIVVGHNQHDRQAHEDVYVAIRDAFNAARRRLHEIPPHGRVAWTDDDERYGFIAASDGTEIYFSESALVDASFDELEEGTEVRFAMHEGEGIDGPQASTVHRVGKHHAP